MSPQLHSQADVLVEVERVLTALLVSGAQRVDGKVAKAYWAGMVIRVDIDAEQVDTSTAS